MNSVSLIIYTVSDVAKSTAFFTSLLGVQPYADNPYYVGFRAGEIEIGLVPASAGGSPGALADVTVPDIKEALATLVAAGAQTVQEPRDVAQGLMVASVKDLDGTPIGLRQFPK